MENKNVTPCDEALGYWTIGIQYLHLVETVASETIRQGNKFSLVFDGPDFSWEELSSQTRWSDSKLVVPLLFDFYHGVEVLLKGFLASKGRLDKKNHELSDLMKTFDELFPDHSLNRLLSRYIVTGQLPEPLASFCSESAISIDDYYQALKYPKSTHGAVYRHTRLKYRSDAGLPFFNDLVSDILQMRLEAVALGRSICPDL
jgi:hypothetical protein